MSDPAEIKKLEKRIADLEKKIDSPKKAKVPRKKSDYNIFVQKFIATEKKKNPDKSHQEHFKEAAAAWSAKKD